MSQKLKKFYRHTGKEQEALTREICALFLGNPNKHLKGKSITEIAEMTDNTRPTIYSYLNRGVELGIDGIAKDEKTGHYERVEITQQEKFEKFSESHQIVEDPLVRDWVLHGLNNAGFSSTGAVATKSHIRAIEKLCNFCKVTPRQLIQEKEITAKYLEQYLDALRDGTIERRQNKVNSSPESAFIPVKMGVRSFVQFHGISLRKGEGGIWNAKVRGHGNYADIRLTPEQFLLLEDYLLKNGGIDSDLYRLVWVGIESCARANALLTTPLSYSVDDTDPENVTYFLTVIESKTKHIKGGKQTKHITRRRTQQSLDFLKDRHTTSLIWEEKISQQGKYYKLLDEMKKLWKAIGCNDHYFREHALHALRHIGAHYWLNASNYDYDFVADLGGWTTTTELKASYGEIPPEIKSRKLAQFRNKINNVGISN